jgi:hypothetical protein
MEIKGNIKRRGVVSRERRPLMLIAVEGRNKTERTYFEGFRHSSSFTVKFARGNDTDPASMISVLEKQMSKDCIPSEGDRAFCVIDMDCDQVKAQCVKDMITKNEAAAFEIILSNPCFEVWILCHYSASTKVFGSNREVIDAVKKIIPNYDKNMDIYPILFCRRDEAIQNAKALIAHRETQGRQRGDIHDNPSTEIHKIVELLK